MLKASYSFLNTRNVVTSEAYSCIFRVKLITMNYSCKYSLLRKEARYLKRTKEKYGIDKTEDYKKKKN